MSPSHIQPQTTRSTRPSARKGKEPMRHGHVIPRNASGRTVARVVHHHGHARARRASSRSERSTSVLGSASSSGASNRKVQNIRERAAEADETSEVVNVESLGGRVVIGDDLRQSPLRRVLLPPSQQVQLQLQPQQPPPPPQQSRSEPGPSTLTGHHHPNGDLDARSAVQEIKVKEVAGPSIKLITPGLFDGDKVKQEVLNQRVDAALKGATSGHRRKIELVSSSEQDSDEDDEDDGESLWSDEESNEDGRRRRHQQQHYHPPPRQTQQQQPPLQSILKGSRSQPLDEDEYDSDDGPLARAAKEAERQRNMFAKLPRESYADLRRKGIGAGPSNLTLLLNPPPEMFPHEHPYRVLSRNSRSTGDIAYQQGGHGYGYGYGHPTHQHQSQQQSQQFQYSHQHPPQRGYGQVPQQHYPVQRQQSQPAYPHPQQYAVAPPPQPRQRPQTPVQAQAQAQQSSGAKPPTRERIGGFGGFGFTAMRPVDQAPKQRQQQPMPEQRAPVQAVAPPPMPHASRRASTGTSRVASTPPVILRSLSKSAVLDPVMQQVTASSFKEPLVAPQPAAAVASPKKRSPPKGERPKHRLGGRPVNVEFSETEDEEASPPSRRVASPAQLKSPMKEKEDGARSGAQMQLEAVMSGKTKSAATSGTTAVATTQGPTLVNGQEPVDEPIQFPQSMAPLRAPPSTPSRGTEAPVNGEHLPHSPTVRIDRPRPHSTYGAPLTHYPPESSAYPQHHTHAGAPSTSGPPCSNAPMYPQYAHEPEPQPIEMPYPYNLPYPTHMLSPRTTRLKMLSSEMPPDLRNDLLWERKANRVHALYRPLGGLRPLSTAANDEEGAPQEPTEEQRAAMLVEEQRRRAMRNRTWAGVFPKPTVW